MSEPMNTEPTGANTEPTGGAPAGASTAEPTGAPAGTNTADPDGIGAQTPFTSTPDPNGGTNTEPTAPLTPEAYADGIKPDEGAKWFFPQDEVKAMAPLLQEVGVTQEQASKLANAFARTRYEQAVKEETERSTRMQGFNNQVREMQLREPKIIEQAQAAISHFCKDSPALMQLFAHTELGCDPAMIRLLACAGRGVVEARGINGAADGVSGNAPKGFAEVMSGGLFK